MKILMGGGRGASKNLLDTQKGCSENIVGLGGGLQKFVHFKTNRRGWGGGGGGS